MSAKKTPVTKQASLGYLFGEPLSSLNPDSVPKQSEIIRLWIQSYNFSCGNSWFFYGQDDVINGLVDVIMSLPVWKSHSQVISKTKSVRNNDVKLVTRADGFGHKHFQTKAEKDLKWLDDLKKEFEKYFEITNLSVSTPRKQKSEGLDDHKVVSIVHTCFHTCTES